MDKRLDPYIRQEYGIDETTKYEIIEISPDELLKFSRLDIIAKLIYLENKSVFDKKLYAEHIKAMTKGSYIEAGNKEKKSIETFCAFFDQLKNDIEKEGYSTEHYLVPIDKNFQILDGAHRVAIALFLKRKITVIKIDTTAKDKYDYTYFEKAGMPSVYLDAMVLGYISTKKNTFIANIWPTAVGKYNEIKVLIEKYGEFGIYKEVFLSEEGAFNYLHQIYSQDDWVGNIDNNFSGVYRKLVPCFQNKTPLRIFVFESDSKDRVFELKERIREIFQVGKHSVHITDTQEESVLMGKLLFNSNSVEFMNTAAITKYKESYRKLQVFWDGFADSAADLLVTGSAVMALYGIREADDIDYLTADFRWADSESHNRYINYYEKELNELIFDPHNFLY